MTPQEIAMKFSSASATCKNGRCPFTSECRGTTETCKMKEVAMVIRSLMVDLETLQIKYATLAGVVKEVLGYITDLENANNKYHKLCVSFQNGYRPKAKIVRKGTKMRRKKKPVDPVEMDGNERYAYEEPKEPKEELPVVFI